MTSGCINHVMLPTLRVPKIRGVWPAIVVGNKDGEGNPGYRVKVKLPWLSEQDTTFWARIAIPMAGPGRGTYVLPEIDDQVLVVFEHGDVNRPIVVGALWSKKQEPVEVNQSGKNNTKLIKSRCGHRIIFDDREGAEKIIIVDKTKRNKIVLNSVDKIVKIESDGDIEVNARANAILHANALKVGATQTLTGIARQLLVHTGARFSFKVAAKLEITGGSAVTNCTHAVATTVDGTGAGFLGASSALPAANAQAPANPHLSEPLTRAEPSELKRLTRSPKDTPAPVHRAGPRNNLLATPGLTNEPLVVAVRWNGGDPAWATRRVHVAVDAATDSAFGAVEIEVLCENIDHVTIQVVAATDEALVLAQTSIAVVAGKAVWRFVPKDHGLMACTDAVAIVEGGGKSAKSMEVIHLHQPYWFGADKSLAYVMAWPPVNRPSPDGSSHYPDSVLQVTVDGAGRSFLQRSGDQLTPYMKAHVGVGIDTVTQSDPRCRFDVRDVQFDLSKLGLWFDSESSLRGLGWATTDEPSGVFGPLTFMGLFTLRRLAMYPKDANQLPAGAYCDGKATELAGPETIRREPLGRAHPPPMQLDSKLATLIRAWRARKLTARIDGSEFEQLQVRWHGGGSVKVQRRMARKILTWLYAIEGVGGYLKYAGAERDWAWALWHRYANKRTPSAVHYARLALDLHDGDGATTPADRFVVVVDKNNKAMFAVYQNLDVIKTDQKHMAPDQTKLASELAVDIATTKHDARRASAIESVLSVSLNRARLSEYLHSKQKRLKSMHATLARQHAQVNDASKAAARTLFGKDGAPMTAADVDKMTRLEAGNGSKAELAHWKVYGESAAKMLVLIARFSALSATLEGVAALIAFTGADAGHRATALASYNSKLEALEQRIDNLIAALRPAIQGVSAVYIYLQRFISWGLARADSPWQVDVKDPAASLGMVSELDPAARAQFAEILLLIGERTARRRIYEQLLQARDNGDAINMPAFGRFVRIDNLVSTSEKLYRIPRSGGQWEWWHFQYPNPMGFQLDANVIELARQFGLSGIVDMVLHKEEYPSAVKGNADVIAERYKWWASVHPYEVDGKIYYSGYTLAELIGQAF